MGRKILLDYVTVKPKLVYSLGILTPSLELHQFSKRRIAALSAMSAKVLVTGASGYLAGHVVQQLQAVGHVVRGTVRSTKNEDKVKHLYNLCPDAKHKLELVEADLTKPETWGPAVEGMDYVIHTASPFPFSAPKNEDELIKPAVEGTLAVLRACAKIPSVKRVVLTSSCAAVDFGITATDSVLKTEADWTDASSKNTRDYVKSKTLAEKAAWDFVKDLGGDDNKFELAVLNPSFILGPPLQGSSCTSVEIIQMIMERQMPRVPRMSINVNDVRDCAAAHVQAMTVPEAAGNRHIISTESVWCQEIANLLKVVFEDQGYNIPTGIMPNFVLWISSFFDDAAKQMYNELDIVHRYDNRRMQQVLKIQPRNVRDTIIEMAYSLIESGFVKKTDKYRGPGGPEERQRYRAAKL